MKKLIFWVLAVTMLVAGGWYGRKTYKVWKQARLLREGRGFLAKSDFRSATLCVKQAVQSDPFNIEACRLMADLAEAAKVPNAPDWRARVVELEPGVVENRVAWARTALRAGNYAQAEEALASVDEAGRKTASYHKTAAALAWSLNLVSVAEAHFVEATRLEPDNPVSQLNLGSIRLLSTNQVLVDEARLALSHLMTNPAVGCDALRHLAMDAMRSRKTDEALKLTLELQQCSNSVFGDKVLELKILEHAKSDRLKPQLAKLLPSAARRVQE